MCDRIGPIGRFLSVLGDILQSRTTHLGDFSSQLGVLRSSWAFFSKSSSHTAGKRFCLKCKSESSWHKFYLFQFQALGWLDPDPGPLKNPEVCPRRPFLLSSAAHLSSCWGFLVSLQLIWNLDVWVSRPVLNRVQDLQIRNVHPT